MHHCTSTEYRGGVPAAEFPTPGEWMLSVAASLRVPHRGPLPFTLGDAVDELGRWSRMAREDAWLRAALRSLDRDVTVGLASVGARLRAEIADLLPDLTTARERPVISVAAKALAARWGSPALIEAAFLDLCDAAAAGTQSATDLAPIAALVLSQVEASGGSRWSVNEAVGLLDDWRGAAQTDTDVPDSPTSKPTPQERLVEALAVLQRQSQSGHVVVWRLYRRAVSPFRASAGPITLMRADWVVPNAERDEGQLFDQRDELRAVIKDNPSLSEEALLRGDGAKERYVLARVDLGYRRVSGANGEARRRIEALVNIAVGAGGSSWIDTGTSVTLLDGKTVGSSFGINQRRSNGPEHDDSYGMGATSELVQYWAQSLHDALDRGPMPEFLIEALASVREAGLIDHRDVHSYDTRPVTPRLATALEDHAVELIATLGGLTADELMDAMTARGEDREVDQVMLGALLEPIEYVRETLFWGDSEVGALERSFTHFDAGARVVTLRKVWDARDALRALPMPPSIARGLEAALEEISDSRAEERVIAAVRASVEVLRGRHRRVRNAITHGNPVSEAAVESVRDFSQRVAGSAVNLALNAFAVHRSVRELLDEEHEARARTRAEIASGRSRLDREQHEK
jgi:hypothetical protein